MTGRVLLAAAGLALAASLFAPWFISPLGPQVSGWEHWAWADVPLAALALALLAAALRSPPRSLRVALFALCALGIAVVLGHGFEPRETTQGRADVSAGPYIALAALAAGAVGAARAPRVLLVTAAAGLVVALFATWTPTTGYFPAEGWTAYGPRLGASGFERWHVLDIALLALAIALLVVALVPAKRPVHAVMAAAAVAAAACVIVAGDTYVWVGDGGSAEGASPGALFALLALTAALAGLALHRNTAS